MSESESNNTEGEKKPAGKSKLLMIAGLVIVLAGGGGGYFFFKKAQHPVSEVVSVKKEPAFIEIKDMMVGAAGATMEQALERPRYFRVKIALEVSDSRQLPAVQVLLPRIEDIFQTYLRELQPADIEGSANIYRLKEELLRRVNLAVQPNKIDAILFKEFLVQ
jgi:flagellar FliL protein